MGCNFFWNLADGEHDTALGEVTLPTGATACVDDDWAEPSCLTHLGKRSAAGFYCFDCRITLHKGGESRIHQGCDCPGKSLNERLLCREHVHDRCPECGQAPAKEAWRDSAVGLELGFAKPHTTRPSGVRSCSSFNWAQDPGPVVAACEARPDEPLICNEYRDIFTGREFLRMLEAQCPVRFTGSIGKWFS